MISFALSLLISTCHCGLFRSKKCAISSTGSSSTWGTEIRNVLVALSCEKSLAGNGTIRRQTTNKRNALFILFVHFGSKNYWAGYSRAGGRRRGGKSSVGREDFTGSKSNGIWVHPKTAASQPSFFIRSITS